MITEHTIIYLTMWAGWATAAATVGLAIFAVLAWRASAHNQAIMQAQLKVTEEAAASQIADQVWGRQVEALAQYLGALIELQDAAPITPDEDYRKTGRITGNHAGSYGDAIRAVDERDALNGHIVRKAEAAGLVWRLLHHNDATPPDDLEDLEDEMILAFHLVKSGAFEEDDYRNPAGLLLDFVQDWQAAPDNRTNLTDRAKEMAQELRTQRLAATP